MPLFSDYLGATEEPLENNDSEFILVWNEVTKRYDHVKKSNLGVDQNLQETLLKILKTVLFIYTLKCVFYEVVFIYLTRIYLTGVMNLLLIHGPSLI